MSKFRRNCIPRNATISEVAEPEHKLKKWYVKGHRTQKVKIAEPPMTNIEQNDILTGKAGRVVEDSASSVAPQIETQNTLVNASPAGFCDAIHSIPFHIVDALSFLLSHSLWSTGTQPKTLLEMLLKKLDEKSVKMA